MFARTENGRQFLARYPLLSLLIAANTAVFVYTWIKFGLSQPESVYEFGGMLPDAVERGELWRFISYAFLHSGGMHFIMNMSFLLIVAPPLEYMLGKVRMLILFALTVVSTSGILYAVGNEAGVGVSGFCYGVLGTFAVLALRRKDLLDRASAQIVWTWIGVGWASTLVIPGISVMGHLGGFLGGLLFGLFAVRPSSVLTPWVPVPSKRRSSQDSGVLADERHEGFGENEIESRMEGEGREHDRT